MKASSVTHTAPDGATVEVGTVTLEGRNFVATGACVSDAGLTAYLGTPTTAFHYPSGRLGRGAAGPVTTWGGETIGRYTLGSSREQWGTRVYYVTITLTDGAVYFGRSQGPGMVINAKRKASQLHKVEVKS